MAALLAEREPTPACMDPEDMLDLVEQGDNHRNDAPLRPHLRLCAFCRAQDATLILNVVG